jgi:hypothetical protein
VDDDEGRGEKGAAVLKADKMRGIGRAKLLLLMLKPMDGGGYWRLDATGGG